MQTQILHTANFHPNNSQKQYQNFTGKYQIISAALKTGKTTFTPRNTIMGKGIAYVRPFDTTLPLRPIEVEF